MVTFIVLKCKVIGVFNVYDFQTGNNKIKLRTKYGNMTQNILFGNAVNATLMCGRKYDILPQNSNCSRESNVHCDILKQMPL
jgi:hypothetical protein